MNRRCFIKLSALSCFAFKLSGCKSPVSTPNIVFILADDMGRSQLGCFGSTFYRSPHIDSLASEGMRFTNAYAACPVCSPTRASIMTGKYPARLHLTDFIAGDSYPYRKLKQPDWQKYLPLEEITIAEVLKANGYSTACFGKWHLSIDKRPPASEPYNPDKQGFDEYFVTYKPTRDQDPNSDAHNVRAITERALDFLERKKQRPFFLFLSHNSIHDPLMESAEKIAEYSRLENSEQPENNPILGAMIETLDESVGGVLQKLKALQLEENTVVIFFSDNGGLERYAEQTPFRGGKATLWEGGLRVPLIVRWPGFVAAGSSCHVPVISVDFFATLCDIAGIKPGQETDGESLKPLLTGTRYSTDRAAIFWHYPHYHTAGDGPSGAVRSGDFKLIERYEASLSGEPGAVELYDLSADPGETTNLAERHRQKAEEMARVLAHWRLRVGAQMPVLNPDFDPERSGERG